MEQVVSRQTTEELPYTRAFEADAQVIDLEPGEALTWPLYAPHRVENLDRFCVVPVDGVPDLAVAVPQRRALHQCRDAQPGRASAQTDGMTTPGTGRALGGVAGAEADGRRSKSRIAAFERDFEPEVGAADGAGAPARLTRGFLQRGHDLDLK